MTFVEKTSLTVNRYAVTEIPVHVGSVSAKETPPPISDWYLEEISKLPLLGAQGDGVRAFVGMLLTIISGQHPLVIIDEPEAFLHPPQARLLGMMLAEQHANGSQVVVATHDTSFIEGVTSARASGGDVTIVRLTRKGANNHVAPLSTSVVADLYKDPLLKYYPILNGLFSQGVVLCEGDSDCIYYRAVLDSLSEVGDGIQASSLNIHFAHCGGKARLAKAVAALRSAKVPIVCLTDIDLIQNEYEFNTLIKACAGEPDEFVALRNVVVNAVEAWKASPSRASVKAEIDAIFAKKQTAELSNSDATRIKNLVTPVSGWKEFQKYGRSKLLGGALSAFDELDAKLRARGIFLVPNGELESFHPEVPRTDKAAWLRNVLENESYLRSAEAKQFVAAIAQTIAAAQ